MSKSKNTRTAPKGRDRDQDQSPLIPPRYQHAAAIGLILLSLLFYFRGPIFEGKIFLGTDSIAAHSFDNFLKDAKQQGIFPLWNPYIFCGMPGYASLTVSGDRFFDISATVLHFFSKAASVILANPTEGWVIFYYIIFALGMYLLAWSKLKHKVASVLVSLAATYSVYIIIWIMAGHNTKIAVMAMFPWLLLLIERLRERFRWLDVLALILLIHFSFIPGHVQMIFYTYLTLGFYLIFYLIRDLVKKTDWKGTVRTGLLLVACGAAAFAMDSDKYLSVLEYNPYSIRGSEPIVKTAGTLSSTGSGGLDYQYATNWSLGVGEVLTFVVPSWYGFGNVEYTGPLTNNQTTKIPLYFGPQPFTDAPQYMGILVLALALIGFWMNRKEPFVQFLSIMIGFSILVSFGREFPILYDPMFHYFPMFNKFRVPSMILVLVQIMIPILAGYGFVSLTGLRENGLTVQQEKRWKYILGGLGVLLVLTFVGRGLYQSIYEMFVGPDQFMRHAAQIGVRNAQVANELYMYVVGLVITDIQLALVWLLLGFGAFYLYLRRTIKFSTLSAVVLVVMIADLWRVDTKPMDLYEPQTQARVFTAPATVQAILDQERGNETAGVVSPYRVLEFENGNPPYNNKLAYWRIQNAYGYQGAKMRKYQDLVDVVGLHNPLLWQLMNVKYIITDRPDTSRWLGLLHDGPDGKVYVNRTVLPRAFFVNRYEVGDGLPLLQDMAKGAFDPRDVAYLAEDPKVKLDRVLPGTEAQFVEYGIQHLTVNVKTLGTNLLVLGDSYYPKGWKATLDGKEIPILRADYQFRAVVIPPGAHTLEMQFDPAGFAFGKNLSLGVNILVIAGLGLTGWNRWRSTRKQRSDE